MCKVLDTNNSGKVYLNKNLLLQTLNISAKTLTRILKKNNVVRHSVKTNNNNLLVFLNSEVCIAKNIGLKTLSDCAHVEETLDNIFLAPKKLGRVLTVKFLSKKTYHGLKQKQEELNKTVLTKDLFKTKQNCKRNKKHNKPLNKNTSQLAGGVKVLSYANNDALVIHEHTLSYGLSLSKLANKLDCSISTLKNDLEQHDKFYVYLKSSNNISECNYFYNTKDELHNKYFLCKRINSFVQRLPNVILFDESNIINKRYLKNKFNQGKNSQIYS